MALVRIATIRRQRHEALGSSLLRRAVTPPSPALATLMGRAKRCLKAAFHSLRVEPWNRLTGFGFALAYR
jgi:hypothetical protein